MSDKDSKGELKPCPFCNSSVSLEKTKDGSFFISHDTKYLDCYLATHQPIWGNDNLLRFAWNGQASRPVTPKEEWDLVDILNLCQRAIEDAIYCEDGLDGATGEAALKMMKETMEEKGIGDKYLDSAAPSPPTKNQTEKECTNHYDDGTKIFPKQHNPNCPKCQKQQTEKKCDHSDSPEYKGEESTAYWTCHDCGKNFIYLIKEKK